jgi:hypothetical protein
MNETAARLWHPWLRINRVLRVMLYVGARDEPALAPRTVAPRERRFRQLGFYATYA